MRIPEPPLEPLDPSPTCSKHNKADCQKCYREEAASTATDFIVTCITYIPETDAYAAIIENDASPLGIVTVKDEVITVVMNGKTTTVKAEKKIKNRDHFALLAREAVKAIIR